MPLSRWTLIPVLLACDFSLQAPIVYSQPEMTSAFFLLLGPTLWVLIFAQIRQSSLVELWSLDCWSLSQA